jgi:flagellar biosynthesis protein FlhB
MSARPHAPSAQRIAEARATGHVPRAPLLSLFGLLGAIAVGVSQAPAFGRELVALFEVPLSGADAFGLLDALWRRTAWSLALVLAIVIGGSWLAQGPAFGTRRTKFAFQGVDRTASVLFGLASVVLAIFLVLDLQLFRIDPNYGWALAMLSVACLAIDIAFARARWFASLWMTRREFLDERRDQGVSPEIAASSRRARS